MAERKTQYNKTRSSKKLPDSVELEALRDSDKTEEPKPKKKSEYKTTPLPFHLTVLSTSGLNVRKQPSQNAPILKALPKGAKVLANKVENGWAFLPQENGWVMTEYTSYKK